ncbi:pentatricopeptide repeat-containing protein At5g18950 [Dioscorea cayenensis subsp. rotundata]|uniref:Pentatricopeptide repeat-containing protein At5g18950 n=1 Tax=Dioscorea cayennensis subsp. rotundata TaxID=55577 RepID=A0AB40AG28_DIOCR|nr:pentatricopeptide repeat-containing protein At5g18950 [Dioscorea cayenensis subsp. rotundata]
MSLVRSGALRRYSSCAHEGEQQAMLAETAKRVCETIRTTPRWESRLLSLFPSAQIFHPDCIRLVLSSSNPLLSLRYFLWLSSSSSSSSSPLDPTPLIDSLARAKAWKPALHAIRSTKCLPETQVLHSLLLLLLDDAAGIDHAFDVLSLLDAQSLPLPTWNAALSGSLRAGKTDLFWLFYQSMMQSGASGGDASTASLLIQALCKEKKLFEACGLLREACRNGIMPDVASITQLISGFSRAGNYGKVSELLHLMIAGGRPPDIVTYQTIIHGLCANGMGDEAFRIFNDLKLRGYAPDTVTYTSMIDGLCKMRRMEEAKTLWCEMASKGMKPNHYTYGALLNGYCKSGDFHHARKVYDEMLSHGYKESIITCNMMIAGLCLHGRMAEAVDMFEGMTKKRIVPDVITYNTLIQGFCKNGSSITHAKDLYKQLLAKGLQPSVSTYTPIIRALCEEGSMADAVTMMTDMVEIRGLEPLIRTYDYIIVGFCKLGEAREALSWLHRMMKGKLKPRNDTLILLVECLSSVGQVDDALSVSNLLLELGYSLGGSACHQLVSALCCKTDKHTTKEWLEEIKRQSQSQRERERERWKKKTIYQRSSGDVFAGIAKSF